MRIATHCSLVGRSSGPFGRRRLISCSLSQAACAVGVSAGTWPSGGSTMNEVLLCLHSLCAELVESFVVRADAVIDARFALGECRFLLGARFCLRREELLSRQFARALHRSNSTGVPDPLQIRLAIGCARIGRFAFCR